MESTNANPGSSFKTLGVIIIGDELLNGQVEDTNSRIICTGASALGVKVGKISVIPDELNIIAKEVREFMNTFDVVVTSGGIGPTHDDVTFEGVARALGDDTFIHPELLNVVQRFFGFTSASDSRTRLARVPRSSKLLYGLDTSTGRRHAYPVVHARNVYMLPGIPSLFHKSYEIIKNYLCDSSVRFHSRTVYVSSEEAAIADFLTALSMKYKDVVTIGSYPTFTNNYYRVRVVLDSQNEVVLSAAHEEAKAHFGKSMVAYDPDPVTHAVDAVFALAQEDSGLGRLVSEAVETIKSVFNQFELHQLLISFNGGKDCTVLLHLVYAVVCQRVPSLDREASSDFHSEARQLLADFPSLLYIRSGSVFPEMEHFVQQSLQFYHLPGYGIVRHRAKSDETLSGHSGENQVNRVPGLIIYEGDVKKSLARLKIDFPKVHGVFMGTRLSDPGCSSLRPFIMTDPDWPQFLRVNPLLNWTYADVWAFLRRLSLPYCPLYDLGYTSIGSMENTHPNPALHYVTESGRSGYRPAYLLADASTERSGRQRRSNRPTININPETRN